MRRNEKNLYKKESRKLKKNTFGKCKNMIILKFTKYNT